MVLGPSQVLSQEGRSSSGYASVLCNFMILYSVLIFFILSKNILKGSEI